MGDDFFDEFDDKIDADWSAVNKEKIEELFKKLSKQEAERIFEAMKEAIAMNNKKKALAKMGLILIQEAINLGLKAI